MSIEAILMPMFAQVALTFVLLFWMGFLRHRALRSGAVKADQIALREPHWPLRVLQIGNAFHNQLELPVLFYVVTLLALIDPDARRRALRALLDVRAVAHRTRLYSCDLEPARPAHRRVRRRRHCTAPDVGDRHRPHPPVLCGLMTPAARASAAIEILADIEARKRPAAEALKDWGVAHRFAGSGDRAAIGNLVFDCLRTRASAAYAMGDGGSRALVLRTLVTGWGLTPEEVGPACRWRPSCA